MPVIQDGDEVNIDVFAVQTFAHSLLQILTGNGAHDDLTLLVHFVRHLWIIEVELGKESVLRTAQVFLRELFQREELVDGIAADLGKVFLKLLRHISGREFEGLMQQVQFVVDVLVQSFLRNAAMLTDLVHGHGLHSKLFEQFEAGKKDFYFFRIHRGWGTAWKHYNQKTFLLFPPSRNFYAKTWFSHFFLIVKGRILIV